MGTAQPQTTKCFACIQGKYMATQYPAQIDNAITLPAVYDGITPVSAPAVNRLRDAILAIEAQLGVDPASVYATVRARLDILEQTINGTSGAGNVIVHGSAQIGQAIIWNGSNWIPSSDFVAQPISTTGDLISGPALSTASATGLNQLTGKLILNAISPLEKSDAGQGIIYFDESSNQFLLSQNGSNYVPLSDVNTTAGGDLHGLYPNPTVIQINGASVPVSGSLVTGSVLQVGGPSQLIYGPVDLSLDVAVNGVLPASKQAPQTLGGDVTGNALDGYVVALRGITILPVAPAPNQVLEFNGTYWAPTNLPSVSTLSGDVIGNINSTTVINIHGASVPASGSLVTGNVLQVVGSSTLAYAPVDLAGGPNYITGTLPEIFQESQTLGGDLFGSTTLAGVGGIRGNSVTAGGVNTGQVLFGTATNTWGPTTISGDVVSSSSVPGSLKVTGLQGFPVNGSTPLPGQFLVATNSGSWGTLYPTGDVSYDGYYDGYASVPGELTVTGIQGVPFSSTAPTQGYFVVATSPSSYGLITTSGDISTQSGNGSNVGQMTVASIQGVGISGTPSSGYILQASSPSAASWVAYHPNEIDGVTVSGTASTGQIIITTSPTTATWQNIPSGSFSPGEDLSGSATLQKVVGIEGFPINASIFNFPAGYNGAILYFTGSSWQFGFPIGDLSGTYPNPTVAKIQGNTVTSGALTKGQFFVATSTSNWAATTLSGDITESGTTAGQLTVTKLQGTTLSATAPTTGQVLEYNGSTWIPTTPASGAFTAGGDLSGTSTSQTVIGIQGVPVSATAPTSGQFLGYNGTNWIPTTSSSFTAGGDLSGTNTSQTVNGIRGISVPSPSGSNTVLTYNAGAYTWSTSSTGITQLTGDVIAGPGSGSQAATVAAIRGNLVATQTLGSAQNGYALTWDNTDGYWKAEAIPSSFVPSGTGIPHIISGVEQATATLIVNADVDSAAAIGYSKLNLTGDIVNTDISAAAAIAGTKISPNFGSQVVQTTGDGYFDNGHFSGTLNAGATTVSSIQDTGLSTGVVHSDSSGNFTSSPVSLVNDITGVLSNAHQASQLLAGDLAGTTSAAVVTGLQTNRVKPQVLGSGQNGYGLVWNNTDGYWEATPPTGGPPTGPAAGDLGGTYPNPLVTGLQGNPVEAAVPQDGYVLAWNQLAGQWQPQPITAGSVTLGGDVTGPANANTVTAIQNTPVSGTTPTTNQVLKYNGSEWLPTTLASSYPPSGPAGGDLTGTYPNPTIADIQNNPVDLGVLGPAQDGYVMSWDNTDGYLTMKPVPSGTFIAGGDLTGTDTSQIVTEIQSNPINLGGLLGALQDGYVLTWDNTLGQLVMKQAATGVALEGDVTGPETDNTVGQRKTFLFMGC